MRGGSEPIHRARGRDGTDTELPRTTPDHARPRQACNEGGGPSPGARVPELHTAAGLQGINAIASNKWTECEARSATGASQAADYCFPGRGEQVLARECGRYLTKLTW